MSLAPIALFVYARLTHTRLTVEALLNNPGAELSDLIIFSDAARTPDKQTNVDEVRAYLETITGFLSVTINYRSNNFGLAKSIIEGVTEVLNVHESVIVLEDDLVTSPYFLSYMNEALDKYAEDERVASIHGYVYPVKQSLPEAFFLRGADCWGWGTWKRGWMHFNPHGQHLLNELKQRKLISAFNFNGVYSFSNMLEGQIDGFNDSWAVRWHASVFLADKLTLHPGRSLVHNIGMDDSGTHCEKTKKFDTHLSKVPINLANIPVAHSFEVAQIFERFLRGQSRWLITYIKAFLKFLIPRSVLLWLKKIAA